MKINKLKMVVESKLEHSAKEKYRAIDIIQHEVGSINYCTWSYIEN
jgi:hypothetical protein